MGNLPGAPDGDPGRAKKILGVDDDEEPGGDAGDCESVGELEAHLVVGARFRLAHEQVWETSADMWRAMVLIWNKEQVRQNAAAEGEGGNAPAKQKPVRLVQDPDDPGD